MDSFLKEHLDFEIRNQLSKNNYEILHKELLRLNWRQQLVIQLRFWEQYSISQVAHEMGISWRAADILIESAIRDLKSGLFKSINQTSSLSAA